MYTHETIQGWNLDEHINHDVYTREMAARMAAMPRPATIQEVEKFLCSTFVDFKPIKSVQKDARTWEVALPLDSGRKMIWGCRLLLVEDNEKTESNGRNSVRPPELVSTRLKVKVSLRRRLVSPRLMCHWGRIPFLGTWWIQFTNKDAGLPWVSSRADLDKYTKPA
jgi:hypothetical protein